jgi:hypothetical protein
VAPRHIEAGETGEPKVGERAHVFYAVASWPETGPAMELHVAAANRAQARARVVAKLRGLVVGVTHPPLVQVFELDDELLAPLTRAT